MEERWWLPAKPLTTTPQEDLNACHSERNPESFRDGAKNLRQNLLCTRSVMIWKIKFVFLQVLI